MVSLEEAKNYLRVDFDDDNQLITSLITSARSLCMDVARTDDEAEFEKMPYAYEAVLYTVAYMYEHREEADFHKLTITLRALLEGSRKAGF